MPSPFTGRCFADAFARATAAGVTDIRQIKRTVRRNGTWFITCEVPA
ncbi:hypothetical protein [Ectopseudomonas toyotomiensis]|uniref:Uncharacterized protein n=1 Tax=Ectopseudomonas toyotomiensis TaxID=554344 RepID=A0A1I5QZT8_9GAMM|nr:hypothetical protein [Pseudomonas toyotomiensis]SFP51824.1 hypothetical protein SAMN05216177_103219 [Pseudomonas toyotomiensis]